MTTIYVRSVNPDRHQARVTIARPRKTRRKSWLKYRVRSLVVSLFWLETRRPKGGIVRLKDFEEGMLSGPRRIP
jgi:hypothetical protein